jgi:protoporphyrinogen oxidase
MAIRGLLGELGLESLMRWKKTRTGFYHDGSLHPFSNAVDFLRFPLLSPVEKIRLARTVWSASRLTDWRSIETLTVEEWLTRLSGPGVFEKIWRPLLLAKLGEDYRTTSATFLWATIQRLYAARKSGLKEELFGYLPGGYARMLGTFQKSLADRNVEVLTSMPIEQIASDGANRHAVHVRGEDAPRYFRNVVVTIPAPLAARVCVSLSSEEQRRLSGVSYLGILCASVLLRRPLTDYYVTNILDSTIPFTGLIEMSALVDGSEFAGRGLLYIPRYVRSDHPDFARTDEELQREMIASLQKMHPNVKPEDILAFRLSRVRHVFPRPEPGYSQRVPPIDSTVAGLSVVNSAQILNGTLNANETVSLAQREALRIHAKYN